VVNAHLLYGKNKQEREWEFRALIKWMSARAKQAEKLYHRNLLLLGDCNLDFEKDIDDMRNEIDAEIKRLNKTALKKISCRQLPNAFPSSNSRYSPHRTTAGANLRPNWAFQPR
jgi:hypothetical protein